LSWSLFTSLTRWQVIHQMMIKLTNRWRTK
jgi:hypothetical protein